jgi:glycerol kinase
MRAGDATSYCVEGMVITAGVLLDWLSGGLGLFADSAALCVAAAGSSGGVAIRPSLQGLGAPHGVLDARGVVAGLSPGTDRGGIARAALEGVAFRTAEIVGLMRGAGIGGDVLPVDGGIATSELFCQIVADMCQLPVRRHAVREGAAYGAAVAASLGAGLVAFADLPTLARYDRTFEPALGADEAASRAAAWRSTLAG